MAALVGAAPDEIVFTSGGTESINAAVFSAVRLQPEKPLILISTVEHSASERAAEAAAGARERPAPAGRSRRASTISATCANCSMPTAPGSRWPA